MKKFTVLVAACLMALSASAQQHVGQWSFIPHVGAGVSGMSDAEGISPTSEQKGKTNASLLAGVALQYQFARSWSASLGAAWALEGCRFEDYSFTSVPEPVDGGYSRHVYEYGDAHVALDYLQVPVMIHYNVDGVKGLSFFAGVQPGFLLSAKTKWEETQFVEKHADADITSDYGWTAEGKRIQKDYDSDLKDDYDFSKFNLSIPVGISYEYYNVVLSARYNIPLMKNYRPFVLDSGTNEPVDRTIKRISRTNTFLITVGYRLGL